MTNRTVVASVVYAPVTIRNYAGGSGGRNDSALGLLEGCAASYDPIIPGVNSTGFMVRQNACVPASQCVWGCLRCMARPPCSRE